MFPKYILQAVRKLVNGAVALFDEQVREGRFVPTHADHSLRNVAARIQVILNEKDIHEN